MTLIILSLMFLTPVITMMTVLLKAAERKQAGGQLTSGLMILLSIGIHILGIRGIMAQYLNLPGSSLLIIGVITTVVTLLLGAALSLLIQEIRQPKR